MTAAADWQQRGLAADAFTLELSGDSWFELMHWHPDMRGWGNAGSDARHTCLLLVRRYLAKAMQALATWPVPSQCWALIDPADSGQDAVYVHTRNPNRDNFPYDFDEVTWDVAGPAWLAAVFPENAYRVGRSGAEEESLYWVLQRQVDS